jgi:preprotein translocase subunit SecF
MNFEKMWDNYNKNYKKLLIIPLILVLFFGSVLIYNRITTGEFLDKDITLTGGTTITVSTTTEFNVDALKASISESFDTTDISIRVLSESFSRKVVGYEIQIGKEVDRDVLTTEIEGIMNIKLTHENSSIGFQGPTLGASFFKVAIYVLLVSFILISIISFYYFRNLAGSFAIVISVIADVICIFGLMELVGIKFSIATIGALLMIIGYSTDSNILLTTNIIKRREGTLESRLKHTLKTELTMDAAAYTTYSIMFLLSNIAIIQHIAIILIIGIFFDEIFTFLLNNGLQRLWVGRHD